MIKALVVLSSLFLSFQSEARSLAPADSADEFCSGMVAYQPQQANIAFAGDLLSTKARGQVCALRETFPEKRGRQYSVTGISMKGNKTTIVLSVDQFPEGDGRPTTRDCKVVVTEIPENTSSVGPNGEISASAMAHFKLVVSKPSCTRARELK